MQGHIRRREGKRGTTWAIVVDVGRDPVTGRRKQKWKSYKTEREAQKALRQKVTVVEDGGDAFPESLTVRDYVVDRWTPHLTKQGKLRPRTIENYDQLTRDHVLPVIGGMQLRSVRVGDVQRVLDAMTAKGLAPGTVSHCRGAMSAAFRQASRWELIAVNPVRDSEAPKNTPAEMRAPTPAELKKIIAAAIGTRFELAILLSATTGARRGEVLGLRWGGVDLDLGRISITEALARVAGQTVYDEPKTAKSKRVIPLRPFVVERLRVHKTAQAQRLLALGIRQTGETPVADDGTGQPFDPDTYTHRAKEIAAAAGVPDCHLHALRHGVLTALANQGDLQNASEIAGHSSIGFTHSVYVHRSEERIARHDEALERALGGAG